MAANGHQVAANGIGISAVSSLEAPKSKRTKLGPKEELADFDKIFPLLLKECLNEGGLSDDRDIGDAISHFLKVCKYATHSIKT